MQGKQHAHIQVSAYAISKAHQTVALFQVINILRCLWYFLLW